MIARWVLQVEVHVGYWPRVSFRRAPRPGDAVVDGGVPGVLVACPECSGGGLLLEPDREVCGAAHPDHPDARCVRSPHEDDWHTLNRPTPAAAPVHWSDCDLHNGPAFPPGPCSCGANPGEQPPVAADQRVRVDRPPAGKNDLDRSAPAPVVRPDDAAEAAAREYFGPDYEGFAAPGDHPGTGHLVAFRAGYDYALPLVPPASGLPPVTNTATEPDALARAHPLHAVITAALRWAGGRAPADRIWGRWYGADHGLGAEGNLWAGDPDDVADVIVRAILEAPPTADTAAAWARLRGTS